MLDELKNLRYSPTKQGLIFFLCDVIRKGKRTVEDINVLCAHAPSSYQMSAVHLLLYCNAFGWIYPDDEGYSISPEKADLLSDNACINESLAIDTLNSLLDNRILSEEMFSYDVDADKIKFNNEMFPLKYSSIRNTLINQGVLEVQRSTQKTNFHISEEFSQVVSNIIIKQKKKFTLEKLKKLNEENEVAGELAEKFVLEFEKKRLPEHMKDKIRIISSIDVSAGYDIISFNSIESVIADRFIEVKAINRENGFYWSDNEYKVAKLKGDHYYLYLVNLSMIEDEEYSPKMVSNPAKYIMGSDEWIVGTQIYYIRKIFE